MNDGWEAGRANDSSGHGSVKSTKFRCDPKFSIIGILINVGIGGIVNVTLGYLLNGERSLDQIMFNFGVGGLLGIVGGTSAKVIKSATLSIGKRLGLQLTARLLYVAGTASMNALFATIAVAMQEHYVEHKPFNWGDFFELYKYNLLINLTFGGFLEPIEHYAEESRIYLRLRAYMQNNKHLPDGWQEWSRAAREHFLKEAKFLNGFSDEKTVQSIILNLSEEIGKWLSEEDAKKEVLEH